MPENADYGVFAVIGFIFIVIAVGVSVDIAIIYWLTDLFWLGSLYVMPVAMLFGGWNLLWICGLLYFMGIGR